MIKFKMPRSTWHGSMSDGGSAMEIRTKSKRHFKEAGWVGLVHMRTWGNRERKAWEVTVYFPICEGNNSGEEKSQSKCRHVEAWVAPRYLRQYVLLISSDMGWSAGQRLNWRHRFKWRKIMLLILLFFLTTILRICFAPLTTMGRGILPWLSVQSVSLFPQLTMFSVT